MYRLPSNSIESGGVTQANSRTLAWFLPMVAAVVFGSIFVFANPNLFDWVSLRITELADRFQQWFAGMSFWEIPFCILALLIGAGLMRPVLPLLRIGPTEEEPLHAEVTRSDYYTPLRNTLWTLIILFAVTLPLFRRASPQDAS